ncbi:MAG: polyphosphate kinase 1, partial [Negativicutes bacterium]|nr:polyphosphate kinase 1 [Negativicutes bacterium]
MMMYDKREYFLNREVSWLKFNARVLQEAEDTSKPLLERLKFIAITSSNLDEFFMIRVAGLKQQLENGITRQDLAGLTAAEQLSEISAAAHEQVKTQYRYLKNIISELEMRSVYFNDVETLPGKAREWIENYFMHTVYPVLTPMAVDAGHPFPFLANRSLNLAVALKGAKHETKTAVVQVPAVLPRIVEVPGYAKRRRFVFLEDIIRTYCDRLFHGYSIKAVLPFRITRNADLSIDEEEAEDLLKEVEKSLRQRRRGQAVRLEIGKTGHRALREFVTGSLTIAEEDIYEIAGPIDATCFFRFTELSGFDHLRYDPIVPQIPADLIGKEDLFAAIRERDILLHHPYESFEPVVKFIQQASADPQVLAIKQTLYRVGGNSPIVKALAQAAENGKQVTVLVELKARFDEENNIQWARRLEEAGAHVIYGLVGLKTHAKIALVVR